MAVAKDFMGGTGFAAAKDSTEGMGFMEGTGFAVVLDSTGDTG